MVIQLCRITQSVLKVLWQGSSLKRKMISSKYFCKNQKILCVLCGLVVMVRTTNGSGKTQTIWLQVSPTGYKKMIILFIDSM
ncbi:hypothetical protein RRG08_035687 [Elysia crispata]|uniref:Uncharacterized protein n=1 Tax=Elysia crispata TaxID=231223 RepID=A0AAE0YJN7_9GAST|nr:hypothetical protein RRG08_035687 [Elysia crispata]